MLTCLHRLRLKLPAMAKGDAPDLAACSWRVSDAGAKAGNPGPGSLTKTPESRYRSFWSTSSGSTIYAHSSFNSSICGFDHLNSTKVRTLRHESPGFSLEDWLDAAVMAVSFVHACDTRTTPGFRFDSPSWSLTRNSTSWSDLTSSKGRRQRSAAFVALTKGTYKPSDLASDCFRLLQLRKTMRICQRKTRKPYYCSSSLLIVSAPATVFPRLQILERTLSRRTGSSSLPQAARNSFNMMSNETRLKFSTSRLIHGENWT
ncbi:hypothetical protein F5I97DRAFT_457324 [Phlebopus sp. FC_14]|nr:hypothetical protein F5I97DRAFT_457324 [Phlebopus sp. FC_14]